MWISKAKLEAMEKRLADLERWQRYEGQFTVYQRTHYPLNHWRDTPNQKVSLMSAIYLIMAHLGMEFQYIEGKPAEVKMTEIGK